MNNFRLDRREWIWTTRKDYGIGDIVEIHDRGLFNKKKTLNRIFKDINKLKTEYPEMVFNIKIINADKDGFINKKLTCKELARIMKITDL